MTSKFIIPFFGLDRQYKNLRDEILSITDAVYSSGQVLDGNYTRIFEREIADRCHRKYAIAVNSCTQGLIFALQELVPESSRILVPAVSFAATINSVLMAGHTPVFCDTDNQALIDIESLDIGLEGAGIHAIMYANLFGNIVDYDRFRVITEFFNQEHPIIIEDAAQSFGASYNGIPSGKLGDVSVLSFDPTKNLPNYGSGGMILTDDHGAAESFYDLRNNGKQSEHDFIGTNSRMSESDCAQMSVKLRHFDKWQARRHDIARYYTDELCEVVDVPVTTHGVIPSWHKYVIKLSERHGLQTALTATGIETKIHYDKALFEMPVGWEFGLDDLHRYREALSFTRECLSLPIYPELTDGEVELVASTIKSYMK